MGGDECRGNHASAILPDDAVLADATDAFRVGWLLDTQFFAAISTAGAIPADGSHPVFPPDISFFIIAWIGSGVIGARMQSVGRRRVAFVQDLRL